MHFSSLLLIRAE